VRVEIVPRDSYGIDRKGVHRKVPEQKEKGSKEKLTTSTRPGTRRYKEQPSNRRPLRISLAREHQKSIVKA